MPLIDRSQILRETRRLLRESPVVALLGPRQSGKTTLARQVLAEKKGHLFDLEDPRDRTRLSQPLSALEGLRGLVILDEVQRHPDLFPVLRVLADRRPLPARFLVLGSASPQLLRQTSETLAGRVRFVDVAGFSLEEVGPPHFRRLLSRGGFPRSFLARSERESFGWREDFIATFIERDLAALGITLRSPANVRRLWTMLAHRHAQLWNGAELAGSLGEAYLTVKHHLDVLTGAFVVRQLPPWLPNVEKRLVKSPKVYIRDSGILHALLGIPTATALDGHPIRGASFEGFVVEAAVRQFGERNVFFFATHAGFEIDIVAQTPKGLVGIEVKWSDAPTMTKSMHLAMEELKLKSLFVVYPGPTRYNLAQGVEVVPAGEIDSLPV